MELYLIRHAQSGNNANPAQRVEDPSLTRLGHQQAARVAERFTSAGITRLFTSPFRRALETTAYLRQATGLTPEIWIDLHEQGGVMRGTDPATYVGCAGMTRDEIRAEFPGYVIPAEIDERGWWKGKPFEGLEAAQTRAERVVQQTIARFARSQERVIFVSHGTFIRLLLGAFIGYPILQRNWLGEVWNTAVSTLLITPEQVQMTSFNSVCHLPPEWIS
ncbi:MAG: histidine phosphatase family protein [Nitrospinota bacterium]|nr:MAG: histidine phosphatase family protein [Nitrospinota bacterium]